MRSLRRVALLVAGTVRVRKSCSMIKCCDDTSFFVYGGKRNLFSAVRGTELLAMLTGIAGTKRLYVVAEFEVEGLGQKFCRKLRKTPSNINALVQIRCHYRFALSDYRSGLQRHNQSFTTFLLNTLQ